MTTHSSKGSSLRFLPLAILLAPALHAINWDNGAPGDNKWSTPENWDGDVVPDGNTDTAAFVGGANVDINVDQDFTIQSYLDGFGGAGFTHRLFGGGTLTIDLNSSGAGLGINNATGNAGGILILNCGVIINNSLGGDTQIGNSNSAGNLLEFGSNGNLTLGTKLQTVPRAGGSIVFDCAFNPSSANLIINSPNVSIGSNHVSSNFGRDVVLLAGSKLAVEGGTVLNTGRKFQVNGTGAELELNAADTINDANVVVGGSNDFLLDVNADQATMGVVNLANGVLTIDVDPSVTGLSFKNSSGQPWGTGSITITGFKENTIRFGTDDTGLTAGQLAVIDGGAYKLSSTGFLTAGTPEIPSIRLVLDPFPEISFLSAVGQTYQLQKSFDLSAGSWNDVVGEVVLGDGTGKILSDVSGGPPGESRAFYRLETN